MPPHPLGLNSRDRRRAKAFIASSIAKNSNALLLPNENRGALLVPNPDVPGGILIDSTDDSNEIVAPEIIQCSFRDIASLNGNNYLTERVLEQFLKRTARNQFTILDSHFYNDLFSTRQIYTYSRIANRTHQDYKHGEHLNNDIFIPIAPYVNHWVIAVIRPLVKKIFVLDSFRTHHLTICTHLLEWTKQEFSYYNRESQFGETSNWTLLGFHDLPQTEQGYPFQTDMTSCGVFSVIYAYYLMKFRTWPTTNDVTQLNIPSMRLFIATELSKSMI